MSSGAAVPTAVVNGTSNIDERGGGVTTPYHHRPSSAMRAASLRKATQMGIHLPTFELGEGSPTGYFTVKRTHLLNKEATLRQSCLQAESIEFTAMRDYYKEWVSDLKYAYRQRQKQFRAHMEEQCAKEKLSGKEGISLVEAEARLEIYRAFLEEYERDHRMREEESARQFAQEKEAQEQLERDARASKTRVKQCLLDIADGIEYCVRDQRRGRLEIEEECQKGIYSILRETRKEELMEEVICTEASDRQTLYKIETYQRGVLWELLQELVFGCLQAESISRREIVGEEERIRLVGRVADGFENLLYYRWYHEEAKKRPPRWVGEDLSQVPIVPPYTPSKLKKLLQFSPMKTPPPTTANTTATAKK